MSKSFINIFNEICDATQNGEHVDSNWVKDCFDLNGYTIIEHNKLIQKNKTIKELRECVEKLDCQKYLYRIGNDEGYRHDENCIKCETLKKIKENK